MSDEHPMCYLICTRRGKYIVTSPYSLREEFVCGLHAKRWLKNHPKLIRPIEPRAAQRRG